MLSDNRIELKQTDYFEKSSCNKGLNTYTTPHIDP